MLNIFFPKKCLGCGKKGDYICQECKKLLIVHSPICPACHKFSKDGKKHLLCEGYLDGIIIGFRYGKLIRKLIFSLKYNHNYDVANFLGSQLSLHILSNENFEKISKNASVSFVPAHRTRSIIFRGYNQSKKLAQIVSKELNLPLIQAAKKIKKTSSQASLDREKRFLNLKDAFVGEKLNFENIILVDDITTTGSSLEILAKEIKKHNSKIKIWGAVVARNY